MEKERATIYDLSRMCNGFDSCDDCPAGYALADDAGCIYLLRKKPDKANEIILKWTKEHPIVTRQDEFLKMFPNADMQDNVLVICPAIIDTASYSENCLETKEECSECRKKYWLTEIIEDELNY